MADLPTAIVSSASMPAIFPPRLFDGKVLMDGGTVWNTNLASAVDRCLELVDSKSQIIIDVAICQHTSLDKTNSTSNTISNFLRYWNIRKAAKELDDVLEFKEAEKDV